MLKDLLLPDIEELIENRDWRNLKDAINDWPEPDVADLLENMEKADAYLIFRLLGKEKAVKVFSELEPPLQRTLLQQLGNEKVRQLLNELSPDDRTELFEDLPGKITQELLQLLAPEQRKEALQLVGYPEDSVGRLMTPDYLSLRSHWTIEEAFKHIRRYGKDAETINMLYVVDENQVLVDDIPLRRLIFAELTDRIESIMDHQFFAVQADADQEHAARMMQHYNLTALPVIDKEGVLLGIVTVDDVIDVIEEEVTEDIQKGASVVPLELSYEATSVWGLYRRRVAWLSLLAVAGFLSSSVIAAFETTLSKIVALAFFIPVLIDSGGNTGSQSATLIIRALAVGELTAGKWAKVIRKEVAIGVLLGVSLGAILYIWGAFWQGGSQIGLVVGLSMIAIIFISNLIGGLLPLVLRKLNLDPAVVSSPLITTVIDATGLVIYFSIARCLLKI